MRIFNDAAAQRFCGALLALAALPHCAIAGAEGCVPLPDRAALRALDSEDLKLLAVNRWVKCGWDQAEPAMQRWREVARADWRRQRRNDHLPYDRQAEALENDFNAELSDLLGINPAELYNELQRFQLMPAPDDAAGLSDILLLDIDAATQWRHYENGVPAAVAFVRRDFERDASTALTLELLLVEHDARNAQLDAARARLDRAEAAWNRAVAGDAGAAASSREAMHYRLEQLRRVLAPVAPVSAVPGAEDWTLYRDSGRFVCGTADLEERRHGVSYLRDHVLQLADPDDALTELLTSAWRSEIGGDSRHTALLLKLLRERHDEAALEQGWREALASIRADDSVVGMTFHGRFLPLPNRVVEDGDSAGTTRERPLSVQELVELVQATPLYRVMHR